MNANRIKNNVQVKERQKAIKTQKIFTLKKNGTVQNDKHKKM